MLKIIFFIFLSLLTLNLANTQEISTHHNYQSEGEEDIMVVTGTKTQKGLKDGPVRTEVITAKDIKEQRYRNASEAILDIPGVMLVNQTAKIGKAAVIQGLGGDRVLVLIDGVPAIENSFSGFDLSQINSSDIKQIEVVKGGASALYGGQAMGGVINIVTNKPIKKFHYSLDISKEEYTSDRPEKETNYNSLRGSVDGKTQNTSYKVSLAHNKNKSIDKDPSTVTRDTPDFKKFTGNVFILQKFSEKNSSYIDYKYHAEESRNYVAKIKAGSSDYTQVYNDGDIRGNRVIAGHKFNPTPNLKFHLYGLKEDIKDNLSLGDDPTTPYKESQKFADFVNERIELQSDIHFLENHVATVGVVYNQNSIEQKNENRTSTTIVIETIDIDNKTSNNVESYIQDDWILDKHEIITGVRYTHDKYFGNHFAPKINYSYLPNWFNNITTNVRASFGTGYRIPNLKERFYVLDHRNMGYIVFGNPNLRAETSQSYQLGIEFSRENTFSVGANLFVNSVKNMIDSATSDDSTNTEMRITYKNINEVRIRGLEQTSSLTLFKNLTLGQSFSYMRVEDIGNKLIVPNRPFYMGNLSLSYKAFSEKLRVHYTLRYMGDSYANNANTEKYDRYTESDLKLNYRLQKNADIYVGLKNIFNATRNAAQDEPSAIYGDAGSGKPILGRVLFVGLNLER